MRVTEKQLRELYEMLLKSGFVGSDIDTTDWGESEKGRKWVDTETHQTKEWDGKKVIILGENPT